MTHCNSLPLTMLIIELDKLKSHCPNFPRNTFRLKGPPIFFLLEEFKWNLTRSGAIISTQSFREFWYLPFQIPVQVLRWTTNLGKKLKTSTDHGNYSHKQGNVCKYVICCYFWKVTSKAIPMVKVPCHKDNTELQNHSLNLDTKCGPAASNQLWYSEIST